MFLEKSPTAHHSIQIHNFARVIRFHAPLANVQGLLAWLNATLSLQGQGASLHLTPSTPHPSHLPLLTPTAVIALGAESLEVSQQVNDGADGMQSSEHLDVVILDAVVSFVSQQDYIAAAPQLDALIHVRASPAASWIATRLV